MTARTSADAPTAAGELDFESELPTGPLALQEGDRVALEKRLDDHAEQIRGLDNELQVVKVASVPRTEFVGYVDAQREHAAQFYATRMEPLERRAIRGAVIGWIGVVLALLAIEVVVLMLVFRR